LDTFIDDEYDFLLENSEVEKLTGLSAAEVADLASVVCRKKNAK
jgi:hypothetical protein